MQNKKKFYNLQESIDAKQKKGYKIYKNFLSVQFVEEWKIEFNFKQIITNVRKRVIIFWPHTLPEERN